MFGKKSTDNDVPEETSAIPTAAPEKRKGFFRRLRERLNKGESWLTYDLAHLMPGGKPNEDFLEERPEIIDVAFSMIRWGKVNPNLMNLNEFIPPSPERKERS